MIRTKAISFNDNNNNNNNNNNGDIFTSCDLTMSGFKYSPVEKRTTTKIHLIVKKKMTVVTILIAMIKNMKK